MAVAFYAVLAYLDWTATPDCEHRGTRPRSIRACCKAFALIGVELMLVTAIALFFSTFSSPFLSAALTLAVYLIGHFGEDLKHLDNLVASPALAMSAAAIYYVLPNLAALDVKSEVVHGVPSVRSRCCSPARRARSTSRLLVGVDARSSRGGI